MPYCANQSTLEVKAVLYPENRIILGNSQASAHVGSLTY